LDLLKGGNIKKFVNSVSVVVNAQTGIKEIVQII
jgi:hypothetical protein